MEKKIGRNFEDLETELELSKDIENTDRLLFLLQNTGQVLENAALTAAFMNYLQNKTQNYNFLLFYYIIQKYEKLNETKNTVKNYRNIHMEMYSVFVDPKAILNVPIKDLKLIKELKESINIPHYTTVYNRAGNYIFDKMIAKTMQKFKNSITMGLEAFSFKNKIYADMDRRKELKVLESMHESIRSSLVRTQKIRCLPHQVIEKKEVATLRDFQITCIFYALNTQLEYFRQSKKYSYLFKFPTSTTIPNTFLSTANHCPLKRYKVKGHNFTDFDSVDVETCIVCDVILWGSFPQGLRCNSCKNVVHKDCRENVKSCQYLKKEQKKFQDQKFNSVNKDVSDEDNQKDFTIQSNSSEQLDKIVEKKDENAQENKRLKSDLSLEINTSNESPSKPFFPLTPFRKNQDPKKSTIKSAKSLNTTDVVKNESELFRSKSTRTPSPEKPIVSIYKNIQEKNKLSDTELEMNSCTGICLEPLIFAYWDSDDEMKVSETFEPENELTTFENISDLLTTEETGAYSRLLVLMEFHHKTKFIRMILKRFKYLLVDRWIKLGEFLDLFELLGLDGIDELYRLLKSLVEILDKCRLHNTYHDEIGRNVYNWLTDNDDENLRCWLRLSMDLCCTNVLNSIKICWTEHKKMNPKLAEILSIEFNRLIVIEQLANMRPLLFNLPMIVGKIVKDLKRFPQYQDEATIWEEVQKKLSYLPRFLDEKCMPVVELVNSGNIVGSTLKVKNGNSVSKFEKFINNFPKSIFKETFIDFQLVLISNLRELHLVNSKMMQPSVYTKDEIEVAAVCYENQMIILQKENEKYILKKFKSINQKKLNPWITFDKVHVTKRTCKEIKNYTHELTILLIDVAVLIQMLFKHEESRDMWFNHVNKKAKRIEKSSSLAVDNPILNDMTSGTFVKEDSKSDELLDKLVLNHLIDSSNSLAKSLDITFERLFKDSENKSEKLKTVFRSGPNSANEFLLSYLHLVHQYAQLGIDMIEESQQRESQSLLRQDAISLYMAKINDLNTKMQKIINTKKENTLSIFYPDYDTENNGLNISVSKNSVRSIQDYIEYIIVQAKEHVSLESKHDIYK